MPPCSRDQIINEKTNVIAAIICFICGVICFLLCWYFTTKGIEYIAMPMIILAIFFVGAALIYLTSAVARAIVCSSEENNRSHPVESAQGISI